MMRLLPILRRQLHRSCLCLRPEHVVQVPSMGDSISEGTVVEIKKEIGQHVNVDEVVMVLETDKVSVDVMSPVAGTLVKHFVELDMDVQVGRDLFVVDGDVAATVAATPVATTPTPVTTPTPTPVKQEKTQTASVRVPRIKFLGKRSLLPHGGVTKSEPVAPRVVIEPSSAKVLLFNDIPLRFARKPISKKEINAINSAASFL
ncbi:hypothetical protein THRCLA_04360 [Thraustotheca clavata]|uniref:Lipoyl-binding domain-containing protein n=1 Tax=Thraustotheca clavata TaxID=74557 RepID=A0A1V9ZZF4_9STRA|nr:hypothetical protein THRCLA_04360 [Thraustotheca clavata]